MEVGRENEGVASDPRHHCRRFRLPHFILVIVELIGEVTIQVLVVAVRPPDKARGIT